MDLLKAELKRKREALQEKGLRQVSTHNCYVVFFPVFGESSRQRILYEDFASAYFVTISLRRAAKSI